MKLELWSISLFNYIYIYIYSGLLYAIYGMAGHFKSPILVYKPNHGHEAEKGLHLYLGLQAVYMRHMTLFFLFSFFVNNDIKIR